MSIYIYMSMERCDGSPGSLLDQRCGMCLTEKLQHWVAPVNGSAMMTDAAEAWTFAKCHWIGRENLHRKPWFFPANLGFSGFLIFPEKPIQ